jgi:hypothetical protein
LDIEIYQNDKNIQFSIYRKPTKTDIIIPNSSCHPYEHKMSSINHVINRIHTYPITRIAKETEKNTIKNILHNNEYDTSLIEKPINQDKQRTDTHTDPQNQKNKMGHIYILWERNRENHKNFP